MSSILFSLSNIAIPLILLTYKTAIRVRKTGQNGCGQWFLLILFTFFSNMIYFIAQESKIYLLGDLVIKLIICFIPKHMNASLEKHISHLHLEILSEHARSYIIEQFYSFHSFLTTLALSKMDDIEQRQFKQAIITQLQDASTSLGKQDSKIIKESAKLSKKLNAAKKHYQNIGVSCDIIKPALPENQNDNTLKKHRSDKKFVKPTGNQNQQKLGDNISISPIEGQSFMKKKNSILIQRSTTDLGLQQKQQRPRMVSTGVKNTVTDKKSYGVKYPQKSESTLKAAKEPSLKFQSDQPSVILNKLDVSEYSDMFEEDQQQQIDEKKQLVTKVEAIVQIGTGSSIRLEIYNIQLYSNDQIRIMSLYGRQFEKHKLVAILPQKHGYYELKLEGGKVKKRRVKFRGKIDSFVKYLQPSSK